MQNARATHCQQVGRSGTTRNFIAEVGEDIAGSSTGTKSRSWLRDCENSTEAGDDVVKTAQQVAPTTSTMAHTIWRAKT